MSAGYVLWDTDTNNAVGETGESVERLSIRPPGVQLLFGDGIERLRLVTATSGPPATITSTPGPA